MVCCRSVPVGDGLMTSFVCVCVVYYGPLGLVHFDTHTDTGKPRSSASRSRTAPRCTASSRRATWTRRSYVSDRAARLLAGRGGVRVAGGARDHEPVHARRPRAGHPRGRRRALGVAGEGPVFLSVDIDVLDPAFAPGTGMPEPGGMTTEDLLLGVPRIAAELAARRRRGRRGDPDCRRLGRHHRARRRARRARDR